jgi:hypothetical protein
LDLLDHVPVAQLAEAGDLKSLQCGFESRQGHYKGGEIMEFENEETQKLYDFLVKTDSITSWIAHRINRNVLGDELYYELLAVSSEARTRYKELVHNNQ